MPRSAFNAAYLPYLTASQRVQIFYGGAGSGKSVFLAARALLDAMTGRNTLVVRQVARTLRASCFAEVQKSVARFGLGDWFQVSRSEMSLTCRHNGAQLLFLGLDDVEKVKSLTPGRGALTDIWVEEATETAYTDVKQLEKRLRGISPHKKRLTLSFNPVSRAHWIYRTYFSDFKEDAGLLTTPHLLILRTTYKDNRFLSPDDRAGMENEADPYFRQVYTLGEWGLQAGGILTRFEEADLSGLPRVKARLRLGLDFGYARAPAAYLLAMVEPGEGSVYVLEGRYLRGLSNQALARHLIPVAQGLPVYCDSAEPKSIAALR